MKNSIVFYHDNCTDGFGAAWVIFNALQERNLDEDQSVKLIPVSYKSSAPMANITSDTIVYIVDYCFDIKTTQKIVDSAKKIVILDHHASNKHILEYFLKHPKCVVKFSLDRSGTMLAWNYFYGNSIEKAPTIVNYISNRDLWLNNLPSSEEIAAYISSYNHDLYNYDCLKTNLEHYFEDCVLDGEAILKRTQVIVDQTVRKARLVKFKGFTVPMVNATTYQSEIGNALAKKYNQCPFSLSYLVRNDGKVSFSMRSDKLGNNFDVAAVAESLGGGGNRNSSGFILSMEDLNSILNGVV